MTEKKNKTAKYKIIESENGISYQFFCDISGALVSETMPIKSDNPETDLLHIWETQAKQYFNFCNRCGKWISDIMYNPDVLECVACSPIEEIPDYCPKCGVHLMETTSFCNKCGARLMYGGGSDV